MTIKKYQERFAPGSVPHEKTIRNWIKKGDLYAERVGKKWFIDPDIKMIEAVNPLVTQVLLSQKNS